MAYFPGFCGNELIRINSSAPYSLEQIDNGLLCMWVISSDPGFRVQLEFIDRPPCDITIGEGALEARTIIKTIHRNSPSYPPFISLNGPSTWIRKQACEQSNSKATTRIDIRQYTAIGRYCHYYYV